jgi:hypothetical protein
MTKTVIIIGIALGIDLFTGSSPSHLVPEYFNRLSGNVENSQFYC